MPKRKRDALEVSTSDGRSHGKQSLDRRTRNAEESIRRAKKGLHRALKVAKGFERQKLGKRYKAAEQKHDEDEVGRIDAEIHALKTLDLNEASESYLYKTLLKGKAIASSSLLPDYVKTYTKPKQGVATANVTARLFNSNPVKEALTVLISPIRSALGIRIARVSAKRERLKDENLHELVDRDQLITSDGDLDSSENSDEDDVAVNEREVSASEDSGAIPRYQNYTGSNEAEDSEGNESFGDLDARVASASDDEAETDLEGFDETATAKSKILHPAINLSPSPSPGLSDSPPPKLKSKEAAGRGPANSAFLPSLTMGGYWSGSESGSKAEDDVEEVAPRKNRRGQRARQQIWEKKYGKRAKHLQKETQSKRGPSKDSRDQGWDLKRGAQLKGDENRRVRRNRERENNGYDGGKPGAVDTTVKEKRSGERRSHQGRVGASATDAKPLHPSWEAARKAKEQRQTGSFAGTKVVFD